MCMFFARKAVGELERETARLQDNVRAVGDIQRSLVTIAAAWHRCLDHASVYQAH